MSQQGVDVRAGNWIQTYSSTWISDMLKETMRPVGSHRDQVGGPQSRKTMIEGQLRRWKVEGGRGKVMVVMMTMVGWQQIER